MKTRIENYKQLKNEIKLSRQKVAQLEILIEEDIADIRKSLQPVNMVGNTIRNMVTSDRNSLVNESINLTIDTLVKKLVLRKSNVFLKLIVSFIAKNFTKNFYFRNADTIREWLLSKLRKSNSHSKEYFREPNAVNWDT